jgi:hypothetical protein
MKEKIAELEQQLEQTKALFFKLQGAIEVLKGLEEESLSEKSEKEVAKDDKK